MLSVHLSLLASAVFASIFTVAAKYLLSEHLLDQFELIFLRLALAALVGGVIEGVWLRTAIDRKDWPKILLLGIVGVLMTQLATVFGLYWTTVFHTSLMVTTIPIITLVLGVLFYNDSLSPSRLAGVLLAFAGVVYLLVNRFGPPGLLPEHALWGDGILLLMAIAYSWFLIASKPLVQKYNILSLITWWNVIGSVGISLLLWGYGLLGFRDFSKDLTLDFLWHLTPSGWWALGFVVLVGTLLMWALTSYALARTSAATVSLYAFVQPLVSALLAVWLLSEPFIPQTALAGGLIVGGVVLASAGEVPLRILRFCLDSCTNPRLRRWGRQNGRNHPEYRPASSNAVLP